MTFVAIDRAISGGAGPAVVPAQARGLLVEIDQQRMPLLAVRHPLGFFCLPVVRDGDLGVCIHVWTSALPSAQTSTSMVHCHSWDLVSFVLYGEVTHTLLEIEDDEQGPDRVFEVVSVGDLDLLSPTPRVVRRRPARRQLVGPGASFRLAAGQFHASDVAADAEVATVVLGRMTGETDLTIGDRELPGHRIHRQSCSRAQTAQLVAVAIRGLERASGDHRAESR